MDPMGWGWEVTSTTYNPVEIGTIILEFGEFCVISFKNLDQILKGGSKVTIVIYGGKVITRL